MRSRNTVKKAIADIGAERVKCMTSEQWIDKDGNIYNIDRAPIKWDKVGKPRDTEVVL